MFNILYSRGKTVDQAWINTSTTCVSLSTAIAKQYSFSFEQSDKHPVIRAFIPQLLTYLSTLKITNLPLLNTLFTPFPQYLLIATTKGNL